MDISTFYAVTAATCFTLVGLWWSVVKDKAEWFQNEVTRRMAGGVFASFLIPGLMTLRRGSGQGMAAQVGGTAQPWIWQLIFIVAGAVGFYSSLRLIQSTRVAAGYGPFSRNR